MFPQSINSTFLEQFPNFTTVFPDTHVISAIINVDQDVDQDWPLYIQDHEGVTHKVFLQPGEMLWYESARLVAK